MLVRFIAIFFILGVLLSIAVKMPAKAVTYVTSTQGVNVSVTVPSAIGAYCGDGSVNQPSEECDDGNNLDGDGCSSSCQLESVSTIAVGGKKREYAAVILSGFSSPDALVSLYRDGLVSATTLAQTDGYWQVEITGLPEGVYNFQLVAEDRFSRLTLPVNLSATISTSTTNLPEVLLPPTLSVENNKIFQNQTFIFSGETKPLSDISLVFFPGNKTIKVRSNESGFWQADVLASNFDVGSYSVKARTVSGGLTSAFSQNLYLSVLPALTGGKCQGPDLNGDGRVDIVDLSILLSKWGQQVEGRLCQDINFDHKVDVVDFSIMLYFWTD